MLQNIKDEVKVAKPEHRTAWRQMMRAKELDSPGVATANRRGPVKLTMTDMEGPEAQIRSGADQAPRCGTKR